MNTQFTYRRTTSCRNKGRYLSSLRVEKLEDRALLSIIPVQGGTPNYFGPEPNWAYSPLPAVDPVTGAVTGGIEKFVDSLAGVTPAGANNLGQYIPLAVADTTTYPESDYYEIAVVEYTEQMHSDLNPTTLRGYVQIETPTNVSVSSHVALAYPDGTPILNAAGNPVYGVDRPHYLGPTIVAMRDVPTRIKFTNYLPTGKGGDLFLPVDTTVMGSGAGPNMFMPMHTHYMAGSSTVSIHAMAPHNLSVGSLVKLEGFAPVAYNGEYRVTAVTSDVSFQVTLNSDPGDEATTMGMVTEMFTDNRATIHLHGGDTVWISDGTQHQWITPAGEATSYPEGVSVQNVPDMPDPGDGSMTFYYSNEQSARLMFYHDHAFGITRLNVYAGEAAGYLLTDAVERDLINRGIIPAAQIPLIIQDKSFIDPTTILTTDPTWPFPVDDSLSNLWLPHVYMPAEDPNVLDGVNPLGRWLYGPWQWPPFPVEHLVVHSVTSILVTNGGSGYSADNPPQVTISHPVVDGAGNPINGVTRTPAIAEAVVDPLTGKVTAINVIDGGSYEGEPVITIDPPADPTDTTATAVAVSFLTPNVPNLSMAAESFMDTAVVNGTVYPYLEVDPKTYEFRILNASDDRFYNLQLVQATSIVSSITVTNGGSGYTRAPSVVITDAGGTGIGATGTAVIDPVTGAVIGVDLLVVGSGYTNPQVTFVGGGGSGATATAAVYNGLSEVGMVPFTDFQPDGSEWPAGWPTFPDQREGGIPDPNKLGPKMIQIGTEGGFLPTPVVFDNIPIGWDKDPLSITVNNVLEHNVFLGSAERADVIVDFSQFAGQTLLLYTDSPAPVPAGDPRVDYYTGNPDQSAEGGNVSTLPGYGPNTRTLMQIRVRATTPAAAFDVQKLMDEFKTTTDPVTGDEIPGVFARGQDPILVPQAPYNDAYGVTNFPELTTAYERINSDWLTFQPLDLTTPDVGDLATEAVTIFNHDKAIIEEWSTDWGRIRTFLGVEVPFTNSTNQTSLWFTVQDPVTEILTDSGDVMSPIGVLGDGTQIWKIAHNGVDTHAIHFHLFNVQLINRIDWAGFVKPPEPNEMGWKDTVRMNPLETAVVAFRPISPDAPFGVPESYRLLDPTMPQGSTTGFVPFDANGDPVTTVNDYYNFGWEYVWHCHLLSHEEMDMMRPIQLDVTTTASGTLVLNDAAVDVNTVTLNWIDPTPISDPTTLGNLANEIGYRIERALIDPISGLPGVYLPIGTALANATSFVDHPLSVAVPSDFSYQVVAYNVSGDTVSNAVTVNAFQNVPTVAIDQATTQLDPTNSGTIHFTVFFGSPVADFTSSGVTLTGTAPGALVATVTGSGRDYDVAVTGMTGNGTVIANIAAGAAHDELGNPTLASASTDNTVTYDVTSPSVTINRATAQLNPANATPIHFTVIFSEPVIGFTAGDVTLSGTAPGTLVGTVTGGGTTYDVAVSGMTGDGTVIATLSADVASDLANNASLASTSTDNSVQYYAGPTISSVMVVQATGPQSSVLRAGESLVMTFHASGSASVTSATVQMDGLNVTPINGPYAAAPGVNFSVLLGAPAAGTHTYSIVATDAAGHHTVLPYTSVFTVTSNPGPTNLGPTISSVTVVPAQGYMTWNALDPDGVASASLTVDGIAVPNINGPYTAPSGVNFSGVFGTVAAGSHAYVITTTDTLGNSSHYNGTFTTAPAPAPTISNVVVVQAQNLMSWNVLSSVGVASSGLTIDGSTVSPIYGPYTAASGVNYSGIFGALASGSHNYVITATDTLGNSSQQAGSFVVAAGVGPTISGIVVVPAQGVMSWNALDPNGVASSSLTIDGTAVSQVFGPYTAPSGVNFAGLFGTLTAGNHNYVITATNTLGNSSQSSGTFAALTVAASAASEGSAASLTDQQLATMVAEAERRLATVSDTQALAAMAGVKIQIADLPGGLLGEAVDKTIFIDRDAAGYGWFIDPTPTDDLEFAAASSPHFLAAGNNSPAAQRVDLLTTVMHEMGHVLGYEHSDSFDLMYPTLSPGTRRTSVEQPALSMAAWGSGGVWGNRSANTGVLDQVFASFDERRAVV